MTVNSVVESAMLFILFIYLFIHLLIYLKILHTFRSVGK